MQSFEQATAGAAVLVGHQEPGPPQVDQGRPEFGRDAGVIVGQPAQEIGRALTLECAVRHLAEGHLFVVVCEVHGLSYVTPVRRSLTRASQYTVGPLPLPPVDFALAPEDEKFRDELRAWLDENLPPFLEAESIGDDAQLSGEASQQRRQKWQRKLHEGGWAAIHWGPDYANGRTINAMQRLLYSEVMAEYRTPGMFNTNGIWQIGPMIIQWGTDEQKAEWLPSILEAEEHWCQGFSEPMAGNDLANLRTTAIYDADTDEYVVNGSKIWISSAHLATWGLFLLRTDPTAIERGKKHEGITAFILNLKTPGIDVRPIRDMAGEELFNEIFFTDVRIPAKWRLGEEGAGWMVAMGTLGFERVGIASQIAILAADLRAMVEAAKSVNPGALDDPSLRERIARIWTEIELARLLVPAGALQNHEGREELARGAVRQAVVVVDGPDAGCAGRRPARSGRVAGQGWTRCGRPGQVDPPLRLPALLDHRRRLDRDSEEHHRRPGDRHARQVALLTFTAAR